MSIRMKWNIFTEMKRQKLYLTISFSIVSVILFYTWIMFIAGESAATWRHYIALVLFIAVALCYFKNYKWVAIAFGIFLFLGVTTVLSLTTHISSFWFGIGDFRTPSINMLSLVLLISYLILNFDLLTDIYLDYKDEKWQNLNWKPNFTVRFLVSYFD